MDSLTARITGVSQGAISKALRRVLDTNRVPATAWASIEDDYINKSAKGAGVYLTLAEVTG